MSLILAADTGGTFTDLAVYDVRDGSVTYTKSLTDYEDLVAGMMRCVDKAGVDVAEAEIMKFGTTLVINTYVQRNGARAALVCTEGFRDVLDLRRGNRTKSFDLNYERDPVLITRDLRFGVDERCAADGTVLKAIEDAEIVRLAETLRDAEVEAVAISLLNAYANPAHEEVVARRLRELLPDVYICAGTELSREWYEYERTSTAAANAYVGPKLKDYIRRLDDRLRQDGFKRSFFLMASNGGAFSIQRAQRQPVMLVESGPVGGCVGAGVYGRALGLDKLIAFDMGGTTAKCAVVEDGIFEVRTPYYVGGDDRGFPVRGGVLDIVEVGTGGGSIAWLDANGTLAVGPRSAGSTPGPVCYGRGGSEPTMTDANLVLDRIGADSFLGGEMTVDRAAAHAALDALAERFGIGGPTGAEDIAKGILELGTLAMASAIKQVTVERGSDAADYALFAFGGGGPLHATSLARELNIPRVIIPPEPGNFSALGMILAKARVDDAMTFVQPLDADMMALAWQRYREMEAKMTEGMQVDFGDVPITFEHHAEMSFKGQKHAIRIAVREGSDELELRALFEESYLRRYGHVERNAPVQFVSLVVAAAAEIKRPQPSDIKPRLGSAPLAKGEREVFFTDADARLKTLVYRRSDLPAGFEAKGPLIVEEYGSTTVIGPSERLRVGELGEIIIDLENLGRQVA